MLRGLVWDGYGHRRCAIGKCTMEYATHNEMKLYLDNCCFNRPYDDQSQLRIRLETEAKLRMQEEIRSGRLELVWSYMLDYENSKNPFWEKRTEIARWRQYSVEYIAQDGEVLKVAHLLRGKTFKSLDALHVACAARARADYFVTTDDGVLNKAGHAERLAITDPIGFIKEVMP